MPKITASKRPIDLRKAATQERQTIMAEHLRSAGLGRLIRGTDGQIELPKIYCQRRSAKLRWKLQREAIAAIDDMRSGELGVLATVIFSQAKSADGPFDPKLLKRVRKSLADLADTTPEIRVMVGCIEADFNRTADGRTHWEFSAHLLMAVKARATADVTVLLKSGLELSRTSDTRRPVLVRALYNPAGAAQYVFKALAVGPICERSSWVGQGPTGKPRTFTRKVRLKRPQLISWLASLSGHDLTDRVIWHSRKKLTKRVIDDDRPGADVSLTLEVATTHGAIHEVEVKPELLITPKAAAKAICNQIGKFPEDDELFEKAISSLRASPVRETRKTKRTGWRLQGWGTDHAFLLPFAAFGPGRKIYEVDRSEQVGDLVGLGSTRGTLAQWQRSVAPKLASSTAGVTGVGSVFGAALIAFSEIAEPWAILICGHSSTGKSSLLDGLSSIQGAAKATLTGADSTLQGLHETGALYNDQVMPIGDLSKLGDKDRWDLIRRLAFDLTEGKSRTISASVRQKIPPRSYRCVPIATYEHDTEMIATQVRGQPLAGQAVRCFNLAAPDGPTGHFDRLPTKDKAVSAALAQDLQKASASYYGTAGQAWLSWLVSQDLNWLKSEVASIVSAFQASVQPSQNADALETRAAQKFGLMLAGLNLAKQAGVIDWSGTLMSDCVAQSFESAMRIVGRRSPDSLRASFIQALTDEGLTIDGAKKKSIRKQLRATPNWVSIRTTRKGVPAIGVRRAQMERVMGRSACGEAIDILIREGQAFPDRNSGGWQKDLPGQGKCRLLHVSLDVLKSA